MANYVHEGNSIDYIPTSAVAAGEVVVIGELVGVARTPIAANALGSLAVTGVFDFPKAPGAGTAITAGANCYWNANEEQATTVDIGNKFIGKCVKAATDADTTVRICLSQ